jgi:peptide/nickel transport system substrate-binding protein
VVLERFDDYFAGKPYLDSIIYRIAKDPNSANIALQNGEINMRMIDPQDYQKLNDTGKFTMVTFPEGRLFYMVFNLNTEIMQKKEVRQAIAHALDKNEMITAAFVSSDFADPASSIFTPDTLYQTNDVMTYEYDPKKAKELLASAGVEGNLKVRLAYVNSNKVMTSLALYTQQKLKEVGIDVELIAMDPNAFSEKATNKENKDFELSFGGYIMGAEPDAYKTLFVSDADYNYAHYKNPEFDALWDQAAVEIDPNKRAELYKEIQQKVAEEATYLPIAYPKAVIAVDKKFGGLDEAHPIPVAMFEDLSKVYVK